MPLILGTNSIKDSTFSVANSCRFNDDDSPSMTKASTTVTNDKKFTISAWCKRCNMGDGSGNEFGIFGHRSNSNNGNSNLQFGFYQDHIYCAFVSNNGSDVHINKVSDALYQDPTAWYHVMLAVDTTQGTAANRNRIYVNGTEVTSFSTDTNAPSDRTFLNNACNIDVGRYTNTGGSHFEFDGYLAEVVYIDGSQLTPTSFGEFNEDSPTIWQPKDVSGLTFGNNGFYLDFEDSSNLGNDANGGTDLTESNLAATDQTTDTCTNNFATLNSIVNYNSGVFTEGNLAITFGDDTIATIGLTRGRWYWEAQRTNSTNEAHFGIGVSNGFYSATSVVSDGDRLYVRGGSSNFNTASNLSILTFGSNSGTPASFASGDVLGFYLDLESSTKNIIIKKNDGATPLVNVDLTYSGEEPIFPYCRMNSGCASSWNFGNPIGSLSSANADANGFGSFEFSPTLSGVNYFAICTKNLAEHG
tara:strand:- start:1076 stop:2491 length:1416 start_codon:yes stop_codon:yes gene_type:complete